MNKSAKNNKTFLFLILSLIYIILILGCSSGGSQIVLECVSPLIPKGDGCCMDADNNGLCDIDEAEVDEEQLEQTEPEFSETPEEPPVQENEKPVETTGPEITSNTKEEAEKVAELFVSSWKSKQYNIMYTMFIPELKNKKTGDEFRAIMELDPFYTKLNDVKLGGVVLIDEKTAQLSITAHTNVQTIEVPAAKLNFVEESWKADLFTDVFDLPLFDAACSGYRYSNSYTEADCAFDLAKKVKDKQYCDISECHYVDCLKALGATAGMLQEAEQCYKCQPVMKTTNECILDIAIKYDKVGACNVIPESKYSDKYCTCYGGFAKQKGTIGYCNTIENPDYKRLCEKKFNGGYC